MDPSAHVAAPQPITLGGKTLLLSPLSIKDFKELEGYLRMLPLQEIKPQLEGLTPDERKHLLDRAYDQVRKIRIGTADFDEASQTFNGICYMLWLCVRRRHPELGLDAAGDLIGQAEFEQISQHVNRMAGYASPDPTAPGAGGTPATTTTATTTSPAVP
jgi:hypothetical protein